MLAVAGEPFDSTEHLFEVKWDGIRALAIGGLNARIWGRDRVDYTARYPELAALRRLPEGTMLDGELVRLTAAGQPDLAAMLARHAVGDPTRAAYLARVQPVTYVVFDLLFQDSRSFVSQPLHERRTWLEALLKSFSNPRLQFSAGVVGPGKAFFEAVLQQGQEGMMAKHLASRYLPGRRSAAWRKIKPRTFAPCVIVGFVPYRRDIRWLVVATPDTQRFLGRVRLRMDSVRRAALTEQLLARIRPNPAVECPGRAIWVEPELHGRLTGLGWTGRGRLRNAEFLGLIDAPGALVGPRTN
jgi:ATP-dependent DNA ligase